MSMIFKGTLTIYFLIAILVLAAAGSVLLRPLVAEAHSVTETVPVETVEETPAQTVTESDILFGSYRYRANEGDNLTYFARRSVQLYLATSTAELDVAQIIAAETLIVRDLGGFEINVGQEVEIDVNLVAQRVYEAYLLDEATLAHWGMYAPIRQSLGHIEPLEIPQSLAVEPETETVVLETADDDSAVASESPAETPAATEAEATEEISVVEDETETVADNATATRDSSFYFTLLGGLILMGIIVWVLVLSFLRNTKDELEDAVSGEDTAKLKDRIADAKLTQKVKDLPKKAGAKKGGRTSRQTKTSKKKPARGRSKK